MIQIDQIKRTTKENILTFIKDKIIQLINILNIY